MNTVTSHRLKRSPSERGMVSIMTTMVLMLVISLIVIGFAQLSRRNQREALDRQLSSQAFYAAETGVNDARNLMQTALTAGQPIVDKTGCTDSGVGGFYGGLNPTINAAANIRYSCLLVDPSPTTLRYNDVGTTSLIVPVTAKAGTISRIQLSWQSKTSTTPISGCPNSLPAGSGNGSFTPTASWTCGYGVLRFDLVPTSTAGSFNVTNLRDTTMTTFGVPFPTPSGSTSIPYRPSTTNDNNAEGVRCTNTRCTLTITGLSQNSYHLRVASLYQNSSLQVSATNGGGTTLELEGAQAVIDSTGKAGDVLRRIQVNVPLRSTSENQLSDYAIQSTDSICKRFAIMNGYFDNEARLGTVSTNSGNRLCTSSP